MWHLLLLLHISPLTLSHWKSRAAHRARSHRDSRIAQESSLCSSPQQSHASSTHEQHTGPCLIHSTDSSPQWCGLAPPASGTTLLHDDAPARILPPRQRPSSNQPWLEAAHTGRCAAVTRVLLPPLRLDLFLVSVGGPYSFLVLSYMARGWWRGTGTVTDSMDGDGARGRRRWGCGMRASPPRRPPSARHRRL
jgi:hypothetical protein